MSDHRVPSPWYFVLLCSWLVTIVVLAFIWGVQPALYIRY